MSNPPDMSQLPSSQGSDPTTSGDWTLLTNFNPGWNYIGVPNAGTLYVNYDSPNLAEQIYVFHQNAANTPINPGENKIAVGVGDAILFQVTNPATDSIRLFYQMV